MLTLATHILKKKIRHIHTYIHTDTWFKQPRRFDMMDHTEKSCLVYKSETFSSINSVRKVQNPKQ